ncbi:hypothetical protein AJ88_34165 [Mesorhizobium amorphae CCBAU 01583]|nr:hypothetical protein AJ88_34165 [Mesorhizobium amorphae CCBAU 01583]
MRGEKPFKNLADFCERVDPKIVGKRVFESLITAGALDCFGHDRAAMMAGVERMMGLASLAQQNAVSGQADIFGASLGAQSQALNLPATEPWLAADRLHREFQVVGFYLSAHPLDEYKAALQKMRVQNWGEFSAAVNAVPLPAGSPAPSPPSRSARHAPATRWASSSFPTRRASTRRCCFPKGWRSIATSWSPVVRW